MSSQPTCQSAFEADNAQGDERETSWRAAAFSRHVPPKFCPNTELKILQQCNDSLRKRKIKNKKSNQRSQNLTELRLVLQPALAPRPVEPALAAHGAHHRAPPVARVPHCRDHVVHVLPAHHALLRNIPQPHLQPNKEDTLREEGRDNVQEFQRAGQPARVSLVKSRTEFGFRCHSLRLLKKNTQKTTLKIKTRKAAAPAAAALWRVNKSSHRGMAA